MEQFDVLKRISELEREIAALLPKNVSIKKVREIYTIIMDLLAMVNEAKSI